MTKDEALAAALTRIEGWGAEHAAASVIDPSGVRASHGDRQRSYRWASVTKPVTTLVALVASERNILDLDEPAGPSGSTVRHLLAHASGLPFEGHSAIGAPGARRIYSNPGFDLVGELIADRTGEPFGDILRSWVLGPLAMTETTYAGRPSEGLRGPLIDLERFVGELFEPTLVRREALGMATSVIFPGLVGVVPGIGRFDPCDWGLGFELRDGKSPHWTGTNNSPATFGHFGGAGTFFWVDPEAGLAIAALTDRGFDAWALQAWPALSDAVLAAAAKSA